MRFFPAVLRASFFVALWGWLFVFAAGSARAIEAVDYAVRLTASVNAAVPNITLRWVADPDATAYTIHRRAPQPGDTWGEPLATLPRTATSYADSAAAFGHAV